MSTPADFEKALAALPPPSPRMSKVLRAHYAAKNRTSIFRELAKAAGYKSWRAVNLQYGLLAKRVGRKMKVKDPRITLLVEFAEPGELRNREWLAFMREDFATALKRVG
jgi:hypothetical protein